ncbi:MAG TPA: carbohydrate ABC transporter permease [Candidatus Dormibacteraeota bacterium]|jgi:multiple sugar transport system permease protein|nr:carbohydrate ABC transporter permease [Candidatus Dormibacteraeota bacterium]
MAISQDLGRIEGGGGIAEPAPRRTRIARNAGRIVAFIVVLFFGSLYAFPVYWMVATSLKGPGEIFHLPLVWWPAILQWSNYSAVFSTFPFVRYFLNSLTIAVPVTIGTTISSSLCAYSLARLRWRGRTACFYLVLATLLIPNWVTLVPLYSLYNQLGWVNTYAPLIVPAFFGDAFSIFLLRQFFLRQPQELIDAARVDGASHARIFIQVIIPLSKPVLVVVALFSFVAAWTDFFNPLVYLSNPNLYTLQVGLFNFFSQHFVNWGGFMGASLMVMLPMVILFLVAQRAFIQGITFTGIRG